MSSPIRVSIWQRFPDLIAHWVPDAVTASAILTLSMVAIALAMRNPFSRVLNAYHQGLWMLLPFTMQMTLIIILSAALGSTRFFRKAIAALARLPRSRNRIIVMAFLSAGVCAYLYWGLGYALGPIIR